MWIQNVFFALAFKCLRGDHLHVYYELTASSKKNKSITAVESSSEVICVLTLKLLSILDLTFQLELLRQISLSDWTLKKKVSQLKS